MVKKAKKRHFLAQSRTADFLMFPRLVLAQSHKILRSPHRPPHSLGNSESGITRPCMPTAHSSSISNTPHPWKSCRNHFYRNQIRSWDRYNFFCFLPTAKTRVPDTGSLSYHILSSHFLLSQFLIVMPTVWIPMPQISDQKNADQKHIKTASEVYITY